MATISPTSIPCSMLIITWKLRTRYLRYVLDDFLLLFRFSFFWEMFRYTYFSLYNKIFCIIFENFQWYGNWIWEEYHFGAEGKASLWGIFFSVEDFKWGHQNPSIPTEVHQGNRGPQSLLIEERSWRFRSFASWKLRLEDEECKIFR